MRNEIASRGTWVKQNWFRPTWYTLSCPAQSRRKVTHLPYIRLLLMLCMVIGHAKHCDVSPVMSLPCYPKEFSFLSVLCLPPHTHSFLFGWCAFLTILHLFALTVDYIAFTGIAFYWNNLNRMYASINWNFCLLLVWISLISTFRHDCFLENWFSYSTFR